MSGEKAAKLAQAVMVWAEPHLKRFWFYAKVELIPPMPQDIPEIVRGFNRVVAGYRTQKWKQLTVKDAWLNTLVTIEVICWFYVGECIGKRHIVGYDV